ncbi:MAG: lysoplasmalogenase [Chitinophagales bacterium]
MKKTVWIILYLIILFADLISVYFDYEALRFYTKPLLMPVLAIYLLTRTKALQSNLRPWIIFALFFSWTGDILLMFEQNGSIFFLLGLSAFLLAQVSYIIFFHGIRMREYIRGNALLLLLVVVYYGILVSVLSPFLGDMKLPVRIYGVVLSFMLMLAMHTVFGKNKKAGLWMMSGAILFVASDSLLAFNKFYAAFDYAEIIIMLTYGLAQLFIINGAVKYLNSEKTE